jgi:hypothetical protein
MAGRVDKDGNKEGRSSKSRKLLSPHGEDMYYEYTQNLILIVTSSDHRYLTDVGMHFYTYHLLKRPPQSQRQ